MKHTLFLVHGMGRHTEDWWREPWEQLVEISRTYRFFRSRDLADLVEPVGITYDAHLQGALERWGALGDEFATFAAAQELRFADDLDWLADLDEDDPGFELSHIADVLIYRFFRLEAARVRDEVKAAIFSHVDERRDPARGGDAEARFSVLAHSLGTAVVHDALAELGAMEAIDGVPNTFRPGRFTFDTLHMVANVSRLAQTKPKVYESVVRPGELESSVTYCERYVNHAHELDPFTLVRSFRPAGFGSRYEDIVVRHAHDWNVHGLAHYLQNPRVHVPILKSLTTAAAIRRREFGERVDAFSRFAGELEGVERFRRELGELGRLAGQLDEDAHLEDNLRTFQAMWAVLRRMKDVVEEERS